MTSAPNEMCATHVYIIKRADGTLKLGVSRHPKARRSQLQNSSPEQLKLVYSRKVGSAGAFRIEQRAMELLKSCRLSGEWFRCDFKTAVDAIEAAITGAPELSSEPPKFANTVWQALYDHAKLPRVTRRQKPWSSRDAQSVLYDRHGERRERRR